MARVTSDAGVEVVAAPDGDAAANPATAAEAASDEDPVATAAADGNGANPPAPQRLVSKIQQALQEVGFRPGPPDGYMGPKTRTAIESFQAAQGLPVDGEASQALLQALQEKAPTKVAAAEPKAMGAPAPADEAKTTAPGDKLAKAVPAEAADRPAKSESGSAGDTSPEPAAGEPTTEAAPAAATASWYETFRDASAALRDKDVDRALALYSKAIDSGALPPAYEAMARNLRGSLLNLRGQQAEAIADLDRAIEIRPDFTAAYVNRGLARLQLKRFPEAIADYDRAIALDPKFIQAYHGRAVAYAQQGDHQRAIEDYDRVSKLDPRFATAYFNRAIAYENLGDQARAAEEYAALYRLEPDYPGLKARMAQLGIEQ